MKKTSDMVKAKIVTNRKSLSVRENFVELKTKIILTSDAVNESNIGFIFDYMKAPISTYDWEQFLSVAQQT